MTSQPSTGLTKELAVLVEDLINHPGSDLAAAIVSVVGDDPAVAQRVYAHLLKSAPELAEQVRPFLPARRLVVCVNFPPYNDASAVTAMKRVIQWGELVDVVSADMSPIRSTDPSLMEAVRPYLRHHLVARGRPTFSSWPGVVGFVSEGVYMLTQLWGDSFPYAEVYSRSMFPSSHILAAVLCVRDPELSWIAEFSDPAQHAVDGSRRAVAKIPKNNLADSLVCACPFPFRARMVERRDVLAWSEYLAYGLAAELIFTNENQLEAMISYIPNVSSEERAMIVERATVAAHPTLGRSWYSRVGPPYRPDPDKISIGYFGEFYANRGVGGLFFALGQVDEDVRGKFQVHLHTSKVQEVREQAARLGLSDVVRVRPYVDFLSFLSLSDTFDILVVADVSTRGYSVNPYLPSKVSDYRGSSAKIWAFIDPGSPLDRLGVSEGYIRTELSDLWSAVSQLRLLAMGAGWSPLM